MIKNSQLATLLGVSLILWLASLAGLVYCGRSALPVQALTVEIVLVGLAGVVSVLVLNRSQQRANLAYRDLSRVKRSLQESHLEIERYEYEIKQSAELRRLVLDSAQEKDLALEKMATALNTAMAEVISLSTSTQDGVLERVQEKAEMMQRYADDLKALAKLELKSQLPRHDYLDFLAVVEGFAEEWNRYGRSRKVKVRVEHQEDQLPLVSDANWLHNLLTRLVQALIRMNENTRIGVHLIAYIDAERGEAVQIRIDAPGRRLNPEQLATVLTDYTGITDKGKDVGPGLSVVVARRLAQMLGGSLEVNNTADGTEAVLVLPRHGGQSESETPAT